MATKNGLRPKQNRAINALLQSRTIADAASAANVGERTLHRWLSEPRFQRSLHTAEEKLLDATTRQLVALQSEAVLTLASLMRGAKNENVKLGATRAILHFRFEVFEQREILERLARLESSLA